MDAQWKGNLREMERRKSSLEFCERMLKYRNDANRFDDIVSSVCDSNAMEARLNLYRIFQSAGKSQAPIGSCGKSPPNPTWVIPPVPVQYGPLKWKRKETDRRPSTDTLRPVGFRQMNRTVDTSHRPPMDISRCTVQFLPAVDIAGRCSPTAEGKGEDITETSPPLVEPVLELKPLKPKPAVEMEFQPSAVPAPIEGLLREWMETWLESRVWCPPTELMVAGTNKEIPEVFPKEIPEVVPKEIPVVIPEEVPVVIPEEVPVVIPEEVPEDIPKEVPKDIPKAVPKDISKEIPEYIPKEVPEDITKEVPQDISKEVPQDISKEVPKDIPKAVPKDISKEVPEDIPKEVPEDIPKEVPEQIPEVIPGEISEAIPKDGVNKPPGSVLKPEFVSVGCGPSLEDVDTSDTGNSFIVDYSSVHLLVSPVSECPTSASDDHISTTPKSASGGNISGIISQSPSDVETPPKVTDGVKDRVTEVTQDPTVHYEPRRSESPSRLRADEETIASATPSEYFSLGEVRISGSFVDAIDSVGQVARSFESSFSFSALESTLSEGQLIMSRAGIGSSGDEERSQGEVLKSPHRACVPTDDLNY